jgi:hypothetical protein
LRDTFAILPCAFLSEDQEILARTQAVADHGDGVAQPRVQFVADPGHAVRQALVQEVFLVDLLDDVEIDHIGFDQFAVDAGAQDRVVTRDIGVPHLVGARLGRAAMAMRLVQRLDREAGRFVEVVVRQDCFFLLRHLPTIHSGPAQRFCTEV